ncbi:DUF2793 domain-containing protein [Psychromarinibacter sp. C21-152]|uniref:DUF2793 domain-containing protein n=1 Tax=Psychromarinibacter sediminicola TaxID=3033385 RepID=A0AAE3NN10_9RHOB|nr:DUF2793 domain-containing protein [Psychromarinibacter sediminicola]MDF0600933.1 DUF2793 domain-containing protein [Psychromarinibacter sediminicola]
MSETMQLALPLLQPAQAQKHVTVNEALVRLDGLTHLTLQSVDTVTPPVAAEDGAAYWVPLGGVNAWDGHAGEVAIWSNGGWVFVQPQTGWRGWIADRHAPALFDGAGWAENGVAASVNRAVSAMTVLEFDHVVSAGASSTTGVVIPKYAMVFAVTARIKAAFSGTLSGWDFGVAGATNRYGSGLGLAQGSWVSGITGQPVTYYSDAPLVLTANGGDFSGGELRVAVHFFSATPPEV